MLLVADRAIDSLRIRIADARAQAFEVAYLPAYATPSRGENLLGSRIIREEFMACCTLVARRNRCGLKVLVSETLSELLAH
jgi:hypothetical protein